MQAKVLKVLKQSISRSSSKWSPGGRCGHYAMGLGRHFSLLEANSHFSVCFYHLCQLLEKFFVHFFVVPWVSEEPIYSQKTGRIPPWPEQAVNGAAAEVLSSSRRQRAMSGSTDLLTSSDLACHYSTPTQTCLRARITGRCLRIGPPATLMQKAADGWKCGLSHIHTPRPSYLPFWAKAPIPLESGPHAPGLPSPSPGWAAAHQHH